MNAYTVTFKGRAVRSALGESSKSDLVIEAWDKGQAKAEADALARKGMVLAGVKCDEVSVVRVARGTRTARR